MAPMTLVELLKISSMPATIERCKDQQEEV
jgi:hypothetical protein